MLELPNSEIQHIPYTATQKGRGVTRLLTELPSNHTILIGEESSAPTAHATYTPVPEYYEGRKDSMQQVEFANLTVSAGEAVLSTQPVALKPYDRPWMAIRDFRTAHALNKDGKVTFEPLGFTKMGDKIALLTRFEQGVVSFDNILWNETAPREKQIEWSLACAAATLIFLHGNGYVHGDFQVKNTAYDINLQSRVIDVTTIRQRQDPHEFGKDISYYLKSLSRFGRQTPYPSQEQVHGIFVDAYYDTIDEIFSRNQRQTMKQTIAALACRLDSVMNDR